MKLDTSLIGNCTLGTLIQATYVGGNGRDEPYALTLDAVGNVFVAGYTESTNFPNTTGALQPALGGGFFDAFVARLSNSLTTPMQATYLGGNGDDRAFAMALDAGGNVVVAGFTASTNFLATAGAAQTGNAGGNDALVAKLTPDLRGDLIFANGFE